MGAQKFFQCLLGFGTMLLIFAVLLIFDPMTTGRHANIVAQNTNTYLGPNEKLPGNPDLVRVQVLVYNDPNPNGAAILSAGFDGTQIPLKPRDIYGYRGQASFQKPPGKYRLQWEVSHGQNTWPRSTSHEETVTLDPRDLWIQITVTGDSAEIS